MKITRFIFNNFEENTYLAVDSASGVAILIDPGMLYASENNAIDDFIKKNGIKLKSVILTHVHLDHFFGVRHLKDEYGVQIMAHEADLPLARIACEQAIRFGMPDVLKEPIEIDTLLHNDEVINVGKSFLQVKSVPGHSPGGIILYDKSDGVAFVGDSIFEGSIGRTDLPGGDYSTLINAIKKTILTLPEDTVLLPGHGDPTTVAREKAQNPFIK